jgi:hypothetical protein
MPMIDVTATEGTFADPQALARAVATAVMSIEQVPDIPLFRQNTAGFVHEIPAGMLADVEGSAAHVGVQVLTNAGALDRDKQLAVVAELTRLVAEARVTRALPTGPGYCSPRHRTVVGVCMAKPTQTVSSSRRRGPKSPHCPPHETRSPNRLARPSSSDNRQDPASPKPSTQRESTSAPLTPIRERNAP